MSAAARQPAQPSWAGSRLTRVDGLGPALYVKWDNALAPRIGCSKLRLLAALQPLLRASGADALLCLATAGSSLVAAAAYACAQWGLECHALVRPQAETVGARRAMASAIGLGCHYVLSPADASLRIAADGPQACLARLRAAGRTPFVLPFGGAHPLGVLGYVEAGMELARDLEALPAAERPARVYVAAATGRLACGLALGLALARPPGSPGLAVVAVAVSPAAPSTAAAWVTILDEMLAAWRERGNRADLSAEAVAASLQPVDGLNGEGYGEPGCAAQLAGRRFARTLGRPLDDTYTAKVLAALLARERDDLGAVFWLSGSAWPAAKAACGVGFDGFLWSAPQPHAAVG